jgi:hypothetical protein
MTARSCDAIEYVPRLHAYALTVRAADPAVRQSAEAGCSRSLAPDTTSPKPEKVVFWKLESGTGQTNGSTYD